MTSAQRPVRRQRGISTDLVHGSGMSSLVGLERKPYVYGGTNTSMTEEEVTEHLASVRRTIAQRRGVPLDDPEHLAATLPVSAPREWHRELAEEDARLLASLATSREARDAACIPPKLVVLHAVPDPETGGEVFGQPAPAALPAPAPEPEPEAEVQPEPDEPGWCDGCGYRTARCTCPGGPRGAKVTAPPQPVSTRCRRCGYLATRCACSGRRGDR